MTMQKYADRIFGVQHLPENRAKKATWNTSGIKHRNQRKINIKNKLISIQLLVSTPFYAGNPEVYCWYTAGKKDHKISASPIDVLWDEQSWTYRQLWEINFDLPINTTRLDYQIAVCADKTSTWIYADNQAVQAAEGTLFSVVLPPPTMPVWAKRAIIYQVFVDRFSPGKHRSWIQEKDLFGICGGTLQGVIDHLDSLQALGFNTIWLSPIFKNDSHHGYNAKDLFTIESRLGSLDDFKFLVDAIHKRGMYLILDFVANHWSDQHPSFQDAQKDKNSPYYAWYRWNDWPEQYDCYFGVSDLPEINLDHPPARKHVLDAAAYWMEMGVDGYRLDHAAGPSPDFWADFYRVCTTVNPDCWLFGEYPAPASALAGIQQVLHPPLDFLINRAVRETFALQNWTLQKFADFLHGHLTYFAENRGPAFLDNHDMNRFLFTSGGRIERLKQAAFVLFTLPNPPILYYGTERGMSQPAPVHTHPADFGTFEMARVPVDWTKSDPDLEVFFRKLINLRERWFPVWFGHRQLFFVDEECGLLMINIEADGKRVLLGVNRGLADCRVPSNCSLPSKLKEYWGNAYLRGKDWFLPPESIAFWF